MLKLKNLIIALVALLLTLSTAKFAACAQRDQDVQALEEDTAMEGAMNSAETGVVEYQPAGTAEEALPTTAIVEGMGHGQFALLLLKEIGAQGYLPPAATAMDAMNFLGHGDPAKGWTGLGCVPPGGWNDVNGTINKEDLCYMLGGTSCADPFEVLLARLKKRLSDILWNMGIRPVGSGTIKVLTPSEPVP